MVGQKTQSIYLEHPEPVGTNLSLRLVLSMLASTLCDIRSDSTNTKNTGCRHICFVHLLQVKILTGRWIRRELTH